MKYLNLWIFAGALFLLSSCTITQEITFNEDFSGKSYTNIDMGEMMTLMKSMNENASDEDEGFGDISEAIEEIKKALDSLEGISNIDVYMDTSNYRFGFSYDFEDLDALNRGLGKSSNFDGGGDGKTQAFRLKGKKLYYSFPKLNLDKEMGMDGEMDGMAGMAGMFTESMKMSIILNFASEVKKVKGMDVEISSDKKKVTIPMDMSGKSDGENAVDIQIKLK